MRPIRADARRNREAVIEGAVRVLAEQPNASIGEVAAASKVGRTTVYRHFPTREDLLTALLERVVEEARALVEDTVAGDPPPTAALRELAVHMVGLGARYRFLSAHRDDPRLRGRDEDSEALAGYLVRAQSLGRLQSSLPVEWMLATFRALCIGAVEELNEGRLQMDTAARLLGDTLVAALGARDAG